MKEKELEELFNRELDAVFSPGKVKDFTPDSGAMNLAKKLARADFSEDSGIKESLRVRLLGGMPVRGFLEKLHYLHFSVYTRTALAAACLLLALLPVIRRPGNIAAPAPNSRFMPEPLYRATGLFRSVSMGKLSGEPLKDFPIELTAGEPIILTQGRKVKLAEGTGIIWETEAATFIYERRAISPDELFQRRILQTEQEAI